MSDREIHQGGCACGENRYETTGNPERARVCHCRYCQLRSGSPFGVGAWFKEENVKLAERQAKFIRIIQIS